MSFMQNTRSGLLPDGSRFVGGIEIQKSVDAAQSSTYEAVALVKSDAAAGDFFRRYEIQVSENPHAQRSVTSIKQVQDVPLSETHFAISVGLIQKTFLLEDVDHDIHIIYPLGVGAIDEGVISPGRKRILTPLFHHASIRKSSIDPVVTSPAYFRGLPFMPITNAYGVETAVAFHITILSDPLWNSRGPNYLVRGFDSHGCMRLREKDLTELFTIVMKSAGTHVPVEVNYFILKRDPSGEPAEYNAALGYMSEQHPYPTRIDGYERVENFAPPGRPPEARRDPVEHLIILEDARGQPDLSGLTGFDANDRDDLQEYLREVRGIQ
jgi:hypothetical protein